MELDIKGKIMMKKLPQNPDEELRKLRRDLKVGNIIGIAAVLMLLSLSVALINMSMKPSNISYVYKGPAINQTVDINYHDLTSQEIKVVDYTLDRVNPLFFVYQTEINFAHNISDECKTKGGVYSGCGGINIHGTGVIHVEWTEDEEWLREVICHELLHTYFYPPKLNSESDPLHAIIYFLGRQGVCYEN